MIARNLGITCLDGVAIICIVLYHVSVLYYSLTQEEISPILLKLNHIGLYIFTFTSGFKLILNHRAHLTDKSFIKKYTPKRLTRLLKPYIGYTILLFPLFFIMRDVINFRDKGVSEETYKRIVIEFLKGNNIIAPHLWYLYMMALITAIILILIYISNLGNRLYVTAPVIILYALITLYILIKYKSNYIIFLLIFILGMLAANYARQDFGNKINHDNYVFKILLILGLNSFIIYLLHYPIFSIFLRFALYIFHFETELIIFIISFLTIISSMLVYKFLKFFRINRLFE